MSGQRVAVQSFLHCFNLLYNKSDSASYVTNQWKPFFKKNHFYMYQFTNYLKQKVEIFVQPEFLFRRVGRDLPIVKAIWGTVKRFSLTFYLSVSLPKEVLDSSKKIGTLTLFYSIQEKKESFGWPCILILSLPAYIIYWLYRV